MLNKMEPRDQLRAAIAEREKRRRCVVSAADALDRANDLLREAETRLATEFADVDRTIAVHHADRVKAWASSGGEKPSIDVPENLIARRKARDETREEVTAARAACEALSGDLDAAKLALAEAERGASEAALPVMLEEAERVATYLDAARREVWRLATQLRALGELWLPTGTDQKPRPVRLSPQVPAALSAEEPQYPPLMRPEVARYLAAHSPTERAELQTADIARRLMRGGELHVTTIVETL